MDIPVGRILFVDMGDSKWGRVMYMVINPPIICETCNSVIFEWKSSAESVICPDCDNVIRERDYYPCPECGDDDYVSLRVITNDSFGYDIQTGEMTEYEDKAGEVLNVCGKSLEKEIKSGVVKLLSAKESVDKKRKLTWTHQDDYDSTQPMPEWIIEKFKYEEQL